MRQNEEVLRLVKECKRAGTVQILHGHDGISFIVTMALLRARPRLEVNLCHIYPVKGKNRIGLLHYKNLFYGGAYQNKKLGNAHLGYGLSICKEELLEVWKVGPGDSVNDILVKVEEYLGPVIEDYLKVSSVRKSKKVQLANKIVGLDCTEKFEELVLSSYNILAYKWKLLSGQGVFTASERKSESKYLNYVDEISRFIAYKCKRQSQLRAIRELLLIGYVALSKVPRSQTHNAEMIPKYCGLLVNYQDARLRSKSDWSQFKDFMYDIAFRSLQGETFSIKSLRNMVGVYIKASALV